MTCKDWIQKWCPEFQVWRDTRHAFKVTMYSHLRLRRAVWKYKLSSSVFHPIQVTLPPIKCVSPNSPSVDLLTQHFEDLKGSPYDPCPLLYLICWTDGGLLILIQLCLEKTSRPAPSSNENVLWPLSSTVPIGCSWLLSSWNAAQMQRNWCFLLLFFFLFENVLM